MKKLLYKLAVWYIGRYNMYHSNFIYSRDLKKLSRLTYRSNTGLAYLFYGSDTEWRNFSNYEVLEYAIQKLADYEDKENA